MIIVCIVLAAGCAGRQGGGISSGPSIARAMRARPQPPLKDPVIRVGLKTDAKTVSITSENVVFFSDGVHEGGSELRVLVGLSFLTRVNTKHSVQVESFSSREKAESAAASLRKQIRYRVYVFFNADRSMYQIRVGPFDSKELAQQAVNDMKNSGYSDAFYVAEESSSGNRPELIINDDSGNLLLRTDRPVRFWNDSLVLGVDNDRYRGIVLVSVNTLGRLTVVNQLNFEDYLKGVVPNEIGGGTAQTFEAVKAQAVAARTYAVKNLKQFDQDGYDLCATPRCQVYSGLSTESETANRAIEETKGEILTYAGEPINALYTSTCGGRTENAEFMFEGWNYPYLKSVDCYPEENGQNLKAVEIQGFNEPWWLAWLKIKLNPELIGNWKDPVNLSEVESATGSVLRFLGKSSCSQSTLRETNWVSIGEYLVDQLCWQAKRDSLLNEKDYRYFLEHLNFSIQPTPETHSFLFLFHDQILLPNESDLPRFNPYQNLTRVDFYQALFRILDHYHQVNASDGVVREITKAEIQIVNDMGVHLYPLHSSVSLYQKIGESLIPTQKLVCSPGDQIEYVLDGEMLRIIVCELNQAGAAVDRSSKYTFWRESFSPSELGEKVSKYADVGEITDLQPLNYGVSRRISELKITGTKGTTVLKGLRVRWALGLRDNLFVIDKTFGEDGKVRKFVFTGRGWGHGVGMCQVGAIGYAKRGKDYREILKHYYSGVEVTRKY
ncbi:MAG TPA: SpoIID/LytB domain-containing protein [Acidobacteriota bacterium]|nr:SpoIID/LytB domain-containing protein [Acidobacteriota bacterium]